MHIVFVCSEYPYDDRPTGGFGAYVVRIVQALTKLGHQVTIICHGSREKIVRRGMLVIRVLGTPSLLQKLIKIIPVPIIQRAISFLIYPLLFSWDVKKTLDSIVTSQSVDIIEGGDFGAELFFYAVASKKYCPIVIKLHTPSILIRLTGRQKINLFFVIMEQMEQRVLRFADALYAPSKDLAKRMQKTTGQVCQAIIPYPMPTKTRGTIETRNKNLILYIGKLQEKKGVFVLVKALISVFAQKPDTRCVLIGPDTFENGSSVLKKLKMFLVKHNVAKHVTFIAPVSQNTVYRYLEKASVIVVPSLWENYPNVILEAALYKTPIVATATGGIPEIVSNKKSALLVAPNDSQQLARAITSTFTDASARSKRAKHAFRTVTLLLSPEKIARATIAFYEQILVKNKVE